MIHRSQCSRLLPRCTLPALLLKNLHSTLATKPKHYCTAVADNLGWVPQENRVEVSRILDLCKRASRAWDSPLVTDFLSPSVMADAMTAINGLADVRGISFGGYPQAERCRLLLGREELMDVVQEDPAEASKVAALQLKGNFLFDPATHPDFLGAILGTGVVRGKVGDILVQGESGAQIMVDSELVEHFEDTLTQVRTVPVKVQAIPLQEINAPPPRIQTMSSTEASLRLDSLASAGFRLSRQKMADLVKGNNVRVNWRPVTKPSVELKKGDIISCTGKGRLEITEVNTTKKGKYAVEMVRFV
mmetsp:Transcript_13770/g.37202  ORF Transcript_13770/g.37202 Transcript_13770/m.37202 type:complete len:303 (+) Transcript_13770:131-1039(+)